MPFPLLVPALATGGLLWLCHFPLAWGWLGWVALVPLLCLVRAPARPRRVFLMAWLSGLFFYWPVLQWMRVADPRMYATWAALATYCSLYLPIGVLLLRRLDRRTRLPLVVTLPVVWTALEFVRAHLFTGFAWYFLGHTQHDFLPMIQVADLAGTYAVTFIVASVNALVFELLYARAGFRRLFALPSEPLLPRRYELVCQAAAVGVLLAATLSYGLWRLRQNDFTPGPRLALVQGNLEQGVRNDRDRPGKDGKTASQTIIAHYAELSDRASWLRPMPDLIVWPETSYPADWEEVSPELPLAQAPPEWQQKVKWSLELPGAVANRWRTHVLLGLNARVLGADESTRRYNSALLIEPLRADLLALNGPLPLAGFPGNLSWGTLIVAVQPNPPALPLGRPAGRYSKRHLVPYGEYVPLRELAPWLGTFSPYDFDYSVTPGEEMTRFRLGPHRFGVIICYEDTDPCLARQYVGAGGERPVDFLLNTSNDGWFEGTSEHEEHLAICRFRAIECRRSVARAVNMGISAVIDPNGRVLAPSRTNDTSKENVHLWEVPDEPSLAFPWWGQLCPSPLRRLCGTIWGLGDDRELPVSRWHEFKKVQGVLTANIPIDSRATLYAQWGDWLPWACWLLVGVGLVSGLGGPLKRRI